MFKLEILKHLIVPQQGGKYSEIDEEPEKEQLEDWELNALADARKGQPTTKVSLADL